MIIIFSTLFLSIVFFIVLLVPLIESQITNLLDTLPDIIAWGQNIAIPWVTSHLGIHVPNATTIKSALVEHLAKTGNTAGVFLNSLFHSGMVLIEWLIKLILVLIVTFYLLLDWDKIMSRVRYLLPRRVEPTLVKLIQECNSVLSAFFRGQLLVMLSIGSFYSIALTLAGLHTGLILGIAIGTFSIIPYLGIITGLLAASIIAFIQFNSFYHVLLIWGIFASGHLLESLCLTPKLIGNRIGLHPIAVIFAVLAGGKLAGFFGVLLALPVAAIIMVCLRFLTKRYHASSLYQ